MKQNSFFSQLYYSGCKPSLILDQIKSGKVSESDIKKSSVKDFVQYLSFMEENSPFEEQQKINELMDMYIHNNKKINRIKKIKGNPVSFLGYLLIKVPLTINNLNHLVNNHSLNLHNDDICFLSSYILKETSFSYEHKLNLLLFLNDLNLNLSGSTINEKKDVLEFYFHSIMNEKDDAQLKSFVNFDLKKFNGGENALLFHIIDDLDLAQLKNKFNFIESEIEHTVLKNKFNYIENDIEHTVTIFDAVMYGAFYNIKNLCIQDKDIFQKVSLFRTNKILDTEEACLDFCNSCLFDFIYESLANDPAGNVNLLNDFVNTISSFSEKFHLNILNSLSLYLDKPLKMQIVWNNISLNDDEEKDKIKQDKLEKLLPLFNYLKIMEEKNNIKVYLKESELTQTTQNRKRI